MSQLSARYLIIVKSRVADPQHFKADPDPDPASHFNKDPDPDRAFHLNADPDPDPAPQKVMGICDQWSIDLQGSILSLQASL